MNYNSVRYGIVVLVILLFASGIILPRIFSHDNGSVLHHKNIVEKGEILKIKKFTTNGGISVWLVEDHSLPLFSVQFAFKNAGSAYDPAGKPGVAKLLSNTLDEGAGEYDSQRFQQTLSDNSISLGYSSSRDYFSGRLKTLSRNKDLAFQLLSLSLTEPRFDDEPVSRMIAANISRLRSSMSDPNWLASRLMNDVAFNGHPYAQNSGGTLSGLQSITPDDLRTFKNQYLARENLVVTAVGDIEAAELARYLDDAFAGLPENQKTIISLQDIEIQVPGIIHLHQKQIPQSIISVYQKGIARDDPDFYAAYLMNYIFGGSGFGSYLMEEAREKRGLTYGIYSGLYTYDHANFMGISTSTKNETAQEIIEIIRGQARLIQNEPISEQALEDAKSYLVGSMMLNLTSTDQIAKLLLSFRMDDLPVTYLDERIEALNAVTRDDIQRVANDILDPDNLTIIVVGKPFLREGAVLVDDISGIE